MLELLGLAPDEIAGRRGPLWVGAIRGTSGVLLVNRPRVRVGVDAARSGSGSGGAGVESVGMGTTHGEDPPWETIAGGKPVTQDSRAGTTSLGRAFVQGGRCSGRGCERVREKHPAGRAQLAAATSHGGVGHYWGAQ